MFISFYTNQLVGRVIDPAYPSDVDVGANYTTYPLDIIS